MCACMRAHAWTYTQHNTTRNKVRECELRTEKVRRRDSGNETGEFRSVVFCRRKRARARVARERVTRAERANERESDRERGDRRAEEET